MEPEMGKRAGDQEFMGWPVLFEESSNNQHSSLEFNKNGLGLQYYKDRGWSQNQLFFVSNLDG